MIRIEWTDRRRLDKGGGGMSATCRCCGREFGEWDADEVLADPETGDALVLVAPADGLCRPCADPEGLPWAHADAHGLVDESCHHGAVQ